MILAIDMNDPDKPVTGTIWGTLPMREFSRKRLEQMWASKHGETPYTVTETQTGDILSIEFQAKKEAA